METLVKKPFKYYAIRVANMVIFRRTINNIICVRSVLYKPGTALRLEQNSYTGGKVVGAMPYESWRQHGGMAIGSAGCVRITRDLYRAMSPYITKSE